MERRQLLCGEEMTKDRVWSILIVRLASSLPLNSEMSQLNKVRLMQDHQVCFIQQQATLFHKGY